MNKLIFGNGTVSNIIKDENSKVITRLDCDISDRDRVREVVSKFNPEVIINCAAVANLEKCQEDLKNAYDSNTLGAINLLIAASENSSKLVHISSGCVVDGNEVVVDENQQPDPKVWYTRTKFWADDFITNYGYENYLILRPRQMISKVPHPNNMITKFKNLKKISAIDEINSITCIEDFSKMIEHLLRVNATGIFNCANTGTLTPFQIAQRMKDTIHPDLEVFRIDYEDFLKTLDNKRVNTVLSVDKLISTGHTPRAATDALAWCLMNYGA